LPFKKEMSKSLLLLCILLFLISSVFCEILVVGSINADIIIPLHRLPDKGETVVAKFSDPQSGRIIAGGKGANQAVSVSRLGAKSTFVCNFGDDSNQKYLQQILEDNNVDISNSNFVNYPSGLGVVFLHDDGDVSCVVNPGANGAWKAFDVSNLFNNPTKIECAMLQNEIPHEINVVIAKKACELGIPVFQDLGGADIDILQYEKHLSNCDYISPNQSELKRLTGFNIDNKDDVIKAAKYLQSKGAKNVLVTLGQNGSLLLTSDNQIIEEDSIKVDKVIDTTGAGDNYRAAFCVSHFVKKKSLKESMLFASAAASISVTKLGAIPACTRSDEVQNLLQKLKGGFYSLICSLSHLLFRSLTHSGYIDDNDEECPYLFASRLNSMKDRSDLWDGGSDIVGLIKRQGKIKGLSLVDFNYPQHLVSKVNQIELDKISKALEESNLKTGAICLRFPKEFQSGAFTNPNNDLRQKAIELTKDACDWAIKLNTNEVVIWSAYCGYDYPFQVNYDDNWNKIVLAFQEICDCYPNLKISLEYKPTDENTRFFTIPSTGAAILLMKQIDRKNFGLTIDYGHCLMAGENPAQSIASVIRCGNDKLFGIQLGDGYSRIGAEDGLAFGSLTYKASLEFVYWLAKNNYKGHIYFDTFPRNEDPIRECEYNIRKFKKMYSIVKKLLKNNTIEKLMEKNDAMSMLELFESMESN